MYKNSIKIGTITANYNSGKYFKACLQGLLNQTAKPDFVVIVDDGSTDNSIEDIHNAFKEIIGSESLDKCDVCIENFIKDGTNFVLLRKENGGPSSARNVALDYLIDKVNVIAINDCDDIFYPTKIQESIDVMLKYHYVGLVYSDYDIYTEKTGIKVREYKEPFSFNRLMEECIVSNNSVISTDIIRRVGKYDETIFGPEDYDMWLRIADVAAVYHIPKALYQYTLTGNNITVTTPSAKFEEHVRMVKQKAFNRRNGAN